MLWNFHRAIDKAAANDTVPGFVYGVVYGRIVRSRSSRSRSWLSRAQQRADEWFWAGELAYIILSLTSGAAWGCCLWPVPSPSTPSKSVTA